LKYESLNLLEPLGLVQACNGNAIPLGVRIAVGVPIRYGLDVPGIESQWRRDFPLEPIDGNYLTFKATTVMARRWIVSVGSFAWHLCDPISLLQNSLIYNDYNSLST